MNDMTPIRPSAFDYSALSDELATEARSIAERVRARHQSQITAIIETGRDLAGIKAKLEHGQFEAWAEAELGMTSRTARNYMSAAVAFDGKSEIISDLPPSTVYSLASPSTPEPVRQQVIERLEAGEKVDPVEVRDLVKEAKAKEREERQLDRLPARKQRDRRKASERRAEEERRRIEAHERRVADETQAAIDAAMIVEKALGDDLGAFVQKLRAASIIEFRRYFLG